MVLAIGRGVLEARRLVVLVQITAGKQIEKMEKEREKKRSINGLTASIAPCRIEHERIRCLRFQSKRFAAFMTLEMLKSAVGLHVGSVGREGKNKWFGVSFCDC